MAKLTKCCICDCELGFVEDDTIPYKKKNYCHDCFSANHKPEIVDQHLFYLHFQKLFNRKPTQAEWTQCRRLINDENSSGEWDWLKIEKVMTYTYEIEKLESTGEYGVIGILPYYEHKADRFYTEYYDLWDRIEEMGSLEGEETHVRIKLKKTKPKKLELESIDAVVNWEEDEDGEI